MCGRYLIILPPADMQALFGFAEQPNFPQRFNIAPTQPVPIVRILHGKRQFALVRWGLVPAWSKEMPKATPLINARADTVAEKPSFRGPFRHRRCLMPADGFYEWRRSGAGPHQPFVIRRQDRGPFAMAAIWELWQTPDGSELETCAIITTEANAALAPIHHRMPVILEPEDWATWLDTSGPNTKDAQALLRPAPDELMQSTPIGDRVNKVAHDDPSLLHEAIVPPKQVAEKKPGDPQFNLF